MKSLQDLIEERKLNKQAKDMIPRQDTSWLSSISGMFVDFFQAISSKVWTVSVKDMPDFKWPEIKLPKIETPVINIPKQIVQVNIPDVKVNMAGFKIPDQEIKVNIPQIKIPDIKIPDVIVDYREPEQMTGFSLGYDNRGELDTITEEYKSGKRIATKEFNKWVINDNRRNT